MLPHVLLFILHEHVKYWLSSTSCAFFVTVMGRRKLRFYQRKRYERKKFQKLPISIHLSDAVMAYRISLPLRFYSGYTTEQLTDIAILNTRLSTSAALPTNWLSIHSVEENKLSVCKLSSSTFQRAPTVFLLVTISADMSWSLKVHGRPCQVDVASTLFQFTPSKLCTVQHILRLVQLLNDSKVCVGNPDEKYVPLIVHHKGLLKDSSGKQL